MPYIGNPAVVGDSTNTFKLLDDIQSFTVTFDATDTAVVSISGDTLTFRNHRFLTGQRVTYTDGGGTAIGGLTDGTVYFIIKVDQNTIQLATNASNAAAGTAIDLTSGAAGGSHTLNVAFDGVNTKFSATHSSGTKASISRAAHISLSINGVIQQPQDTGSPTTGYGVLPGSIIIFRTPPASVDKVFGTFIGEVAPSFDIDDNTIDNFTGDGSTTTFNLSKDVPSSHDVLVTLDGVTQYPTDSSTVRSYSVIESTLTFVSAPDTGVAIQVRHIGFAGATTSAVTGFYGRQGNVALTGTDDVSVQNISGVGATFTSNVNIEGVLTYEDVTNVDSIGIITARAGVLVGSGITLSKDGDGFFTGIVTATSYYGDGSNLSNITSTTINNNADNRLITGSGTANTLNGESTLTYDGTNLDLGDDKKIRVGASQDLEIYHSGTYNRSYIQATGTNHDLSIAADEIALTNSAISQTLAKFISGASVELYENGTKVAETTSGGFNVEGVTYSNGLDMDDSHKILLGTGDDLEIFHNGSNAYIKNGTGQLLLRSGTHTFENAAGSTEYARIDASGRLVIGHTSNIGIANHNGRFQLHGTDYDTATMSIVHNGTDSFGPFLFFASQRSGSPGGSTVLQNNDAVGTIRFHAGDGTDMASYCAAIQVNIDGTPGSNDVPGRLTFSTTADGASSPTERMRINSSGQVLIGADTQGSADAYVNNFMIAETSGSAGMSIQSYNSTSSYTTIALGDRTTHNRGYIEQRCGDNGRMTIGLNGSGSFRFIGKNSGGSTAERMRITYDGVTFNGDTASANALDDYEEGTWTPNPTESGNNVSTSHATGRYVKIGAMVFCFWRIDLNTTSAGGHLIITGLPFTNSSTVPATGGFAADYQTYDVEDGPILHVPNNQTNIQFYKNSGQNFNANNGSGKSFRGCTIISTA